MYTIRIPEIASTRVFARRFLTDLPADIAGSSVLVDCSSVASASSSFLDELLIVVVEERHAAAVTFAETPDRASSYLLRAAASREISDRVHVHTRERVNA